MTGSPPLRIFEPRRHGWLAARLGLAMVAVAATESIGLMMLAPMLVALGGAGDGAGIAGGIARMVARLGIPLEPGPLLAAFVALAVARAIILQLRNMAGHAFEVSVVDGLRARAWSALLQCDWRTLSAMRQSDNASLLLTEVDRVGAAVNQGIAALAVAVTLAGVCLAALAMSPAVALAMALGGIVALLAYRRLRRNAQALGQQMGQALRQVHGAVSEGLGALRVIKSFGKEAEVARDLMQEFQGLRAAQRGFMLESGLGQAGLQIVGSLVLALGVWLAIVRGSASPVMVLPFVVLFARALPLLGALQLSWQTWASCSPAIAKTRALIAEAEAAREDDTLAEVAPTLKDALSIAAVTVRFPGREASALDRVSLTIPAGRIVVLAGPSGAGKSTLADLAGGLIGPDEGTVSVDGEVLEGGLRRAWRGRVAYVQQDPVLFDGTIRDNLRWANAAASEADLQRVLGEASAQFVLALPEGLDTPVGEGGRRLSGGERQRVVLARALLRSPSLLILDEATSALDAENEATIARAIAGLAGRLAVLIIGHRGALQHIADIVVNLLEGKRVPAESDNQQPD